MTARHSKKGLLSVVVDLVLFIITIVAIVALLFSYFAPCVNPNTNYRFAFFGLAAPLIYLANTVLMLYWTVRWKWIALVMLVLLVVGSGNISKFIRPGVNKHYEKSTQGALKILTYNVGGFLGYDDSRKPINNTRSIAEFITEQDPDIICLQEYEINGINRTLLDTVFSRWNYREISFERQNDNYGLGLAIYSKYPLRSPGKMDYPNSSNSSMWADVIVRRDTLRIFNNHLQTTGINEDDRSFISSEYLTDLARSDRAQGVAVKARGIAGKLKRNFQIRADQVDSIAPVIRRERSRVVVCGDFNDTPMSYTYRNMKGDLVDSFRKKGKGISATYKELYGLLRIDYVMHSHDLETVFYDAPPLPWSDHNPVIVELKIKQP